MTTDDILNEKIVKAYKEVLGINEAHADAASAYKEKVSIIEKSIKLLQQKVKAHAKKQKNEPKNWGYVGDMGHWIEKLDDIISPR